jgi:internalin A
VGKTTLARKIEEVFAQLLELMKKFELCYELPSPAHTYLVPKLVTVDQPNDFVWDPTHSLQVYYEYDVMPKGILQRLMVRRHDILSKSWDIWQYAAVFQQGPAEALVSYDGLRTIRLSARGQRANYLMHLLCTEIDTIHQSYTFTEKLGVKKMVPCNCTQCLRSDQPEFYEYDNLMNRLQKNKRTVECNRSFEDVPVRELLERVFEKEQQIEVEVERKKVFISYASEDLNYLKTFEKQLQVIKNKIELYYDLKISPGAKRGEVVYKQMQEADIIVFLISASLFAAKYVCETEIPIAMKRLENDEAVTVVPIVVCECLWEKSVFGELNALLKGKAIQTFEHPDSAWKEVVQRISGLLE